MTLKAFCGIIRSLNDALSEIESESGDAIITIDIGDGDDEQRAPVSQIVWDSSTNTVLLK